MAVDYQQVRSLTREAARGAFTELRQAHPDETFYAFALYTDDDGMTAEPAANSEEGLRRKAGENAEQPYHRWGTAEWAYEAAGSERFRPYTTSSTRSGTWTTLRVWKRTLMKPPGRIALRPTRGDRRSSPR